MELTWMGRYRDLMESLVVQINLFARDLKVKNKVYEDIYLTSQEWQVLEYIIEHDDDDGSMIQISDRLAIPQSSFSKCTKSLCENGLVDKYQLVGNRKNIILKASDLGIEVYKVHSKALAEGAFKEFFQALDSLSDDDLASVAKAIKALSSEMPEEARRPKLIKIDPS